MHAKKKSSQLPDALQWDIPEFPTYERGFWWYVWMSFGALLLLGYAVYTANFLLALIVFMVVLIVFLHSSKAPTRVTVTCDGRGITIGGRFYHYHDLRSFWIAYDPPDVHSIHILFRSTLKPRLAIDLREQNPVMVREFLLEFMEENLKEDDEPFADTLSRFLKL